MVVDSRLRAEPAVVARGNHGERRSGASRIVGAALLALLVALFTLFTPSAASAQTSCPSSIDFTGAAVNDTRALDVSGCSEAIRAGLYMNSGLDTAFYLPMGYSTTQESIATLTFSNGARVTIQPISTQSGLTYDRYIVTLRSQATSAGTATGTFYYASASCPITQNCPLVSNQGTYYGTSDTIKTITFTTPLGAAATTTTLSSSGAITIGSNVTYTATVSGGSSPSGTVAFSDGGNGITGCGAVAVSAGTAQCTTTPSTIGTHMITAVYSGDASNATSTSNSYSQVVNAPAPTVTGLSTIAGPLGGGTSVTIFGTGFTGVTAVKFGANPATGITVVNTTQITATAPAGAAGTVDVRVTAAGGTSATSASDFFTYVAAPTVTSISPTSGPAAGGTSVTIDGTGFSTFVAANVRFGANAASNVTVVSATRITATAPAGSAGTVDVTVITPGGTSATSASDQFTYVAAPTVSSISPTSGRTAGGTVVAISGTGFNFASAVKFGANTSAGYTINSATSITAITPPGSAGTVDVTVTTPGGTSATSANDQFTYATPTLAVTMTHSGSATQGSAFSYAINPSVSGAATTGATVTASFTLPAGMTYSHAGGTGWSCSGSGQSGTCTYASIMSVGSGSPITLDVAVAASAATSLSPSVSLSGGGASNTPTASDTTVVVQVPASVAIIGGDNQTVTVGTAFPLSLQVTVKDAASAFISGATVTFSAPASGASATFSGGGTATTNASGVATISATANAVAGAYSISAQAGSSSVNFSLTNLAPAPTVTSISPTSGTTLGGTVVTISGTGFSGTSAVTFGATPATGFTVNSATQITATSPAGSGSVDVRVTTAGGTSAISASDVFAYVIPATVTSISPASGPAAGGTVVTITGANFRLTNGVKFGATDATAFTIVNGTQITATAPAGTGTVDVTVLRSGTVSATSAADQFTYIEAPAIASISPASGPTAGGTSVTISGTGFTGATGVKFGANPATGITIASDTSLTATAPAGSAGTVDVTVTTPGGTSATSASDQYTYIAAPVLVSRTWVSRSGNDANACSRSAPCLTFAGAFANTLAGGEINCLDSGDYGAVTITRAVAIVCDTAKAHIRVAGSDGIVVNAGASDAVTLSGLDIAADPTNTAFSGIRLLSAGSLAIADTQLRGFAGANYAVTIVPTVPTVTVLVDRVSVASSTASTAGGLLVSPASGGTAKVSILRSRFDGSAGTGVRFDSVGKTGVTIAALIQDSLLTANNVALLAKAPAGTGTISLTVLGTSFSRNSYGASINGAVTALFGDSTISTNGTGLAVMGGAVVRSAGDNRLGGNTSDGAFTAPAQRR